MAEAAPRPTAESARFPAEDRAATSPQVAAVRACAKDWRNTPLAERINLVRRLAATLNVEAESLAALIAAEVGKPIRFCRSELQHCLDMLDAIARRAKHADETIATNPAWFARRRPHGVVAAITPWNNPLYIPLGKIVPAVVFGNGVVWKPAPEARETSRSLLHCLGKAGWPEGLIGLVEGGPREGEALMRERWRRRGDDHWLPRRRTRGAGYLRRAAHSAPGRAWWQQCRHRLARRRSRCSRARRGGRRLRNGGSALHCQPPRHRAR